MKGTTLFIAGLLSLLISASSFAELNPNQERFVKSLSSPNAYSLKSVSQSIARQAEFNTVVLDSVAENIATLYPRAAKGDADAIAYAIKTLMASKNPRYSSFMKDVSKDKQALRKVRKYAKKATKKLGKPEGEQYVAGSFDFAKHIGKSDKPKGKVASGNEVSNDNSAFQDLSNVREGMTMQEVMNLVGPYTSIAQHETGKRWIPFNYKGGDTTRQVARYKGKGHIVFSNVSHYSATLVVREVVLNEHESGY